jgi:hypothetical protein
VATLVVDLLEVIDVDEQEGERLAFRGREFEVMGELLLERAMVPEAGQDVDERIGARPTVGLDQVPTLGVEGSDLAQHEAAGETRNGGDAHANRDDRRHRHGRPSPAGGQRSKEQQGAAQHEVDEQCDCQPHLDHLDPLVRVPAALGAPRRDRSPLVATPGIGRGSGGRRSNGTIRRYRSAPPIGPQTCTPHVPTFGSPSGAGAPSCPARSMVPSRGCACA